MILPQASMPAIPRFSRFAWLMGLYAENYLSIRQVIDIAGIPEGRTVSSIGDGLDLHIDVLARHRFMLELRLSYGFSDPLTGRPDPSAYVRVYSDARQAEVTHCYVGQRWQDVLGVHPSSRTVFAHRLRMNTFLSKWLAYLVLAGHGDRSTREGSTCARAQAVTA